MGGRWQVVVAVLMAYAIMAILISPAVASPMGTLTSKHTLQPPTVIVPLAAILINSAMYNPMVAQELVIARPAHPIASDLDLLDLTTARLC
jgi:hypothetical protein